MTFRAKFMTCRLYIYYFFPKTNSKKLNKIICDAELFFEPKTKTGNQNQKPKPETKTISCKLAQKEGKCSMDPAVTWLSTQY
jgi:hypothetical protein